MQFITQALFEHPFWVFLLGDVAELHSDSLRHAPFFRKHAAIFFLVVYQLSFDPSIAAINLIQPGNLKKKKNRGQEPSF